MRRVVLHLHLTHVTLEANEHTLRVRYSLGMNSFRAFSTRLDSRAITLLLLVVRVDSSTIQRIVEILSRLNALLSGCYKLIAVRREG